MPEYQGIIKSILEEGMAEAQIIPQQSGIPGAPGVNVCHCASESSRVSFKAENRAGAGVGDCVQISRNISGIFKNIIILIGIPVLGLVLGLSVVLVLKETLFVTPFYLVVASILGFVYGIGTASVLYRKLSDQSAFVITDILEPCDSIRLQEGKKVSCVQDGPASCEKCIINAHNQ